MPPTLDYARRHDPWKDAVRCLLPVALKLLLGLMMAGACIVAAVEWSWRSRVVATVAGADGVTPALELRCDSRGDLECVELPSLRRFPIARDFFTSRIVASTSWPDPSHVVLEMTDGVRVAIDDLGTGEGRVEHASMR
jgi:hypothetical protein